MNEELWTAVPGFPDYAISTIGRIKSLRYDRILSPRMNSYGKRRVVLYRDQIPHDLYVDKLLIEAFVYGVPTTRSVYFRRILVKELGKVFTSVQECADHIGGDPSSIYRVLRGERQSHLGYTFLYIEER